MGVPRVTDPLDALWRVICSLGTAVPLVVRVPETVKDWLAAGVELSAESESWVARGVGVGSTAVTVTTLLVDA